MRMTATRNPTSTIVWGMRRGAMFPGGTTGCTQKVFPVEMLRSIDASLPFDRFGQWRFTCWLMTLPTHKPRQIRR